MTVVASTTPHAVFVGRWCPLHRGHTAIVEKVHQRTGAPVLILVRDTEWDELPAVYRQRMVGAWLEASGIPGRAVVIPDVAGVYYGRGVGYEVAQVEVDERTRGISATEIRGLRAAGDPAWRALVAPGVAEFIDREGL